MKKYIIALDIDECLVDDKKELSEYTKRVLDECRKRGAVICISSTRGFGTCEDVAREISADYVCCQAGNMIVDVKNNKIIYKNAFEHEAVSDLIDEFLPYTNNFIMDSDYDLFGGIGDEFASFWGVVPCAIDNLKKKDIYKMCVWYDDSFGKKIMDYCKRHGFVCRPMRGSPFMLITPEGSDKYFALEKLMEIFGTDVEHLFVFGDDHSDLMSIEKAKFGVAVANSRPEVLAAAKFVAESNNDNGVAKFLEERFLR